jgi:hypothetical protein
MEGGANHWQSVCFCRRHGGAVRAALLEALTLTLPDGQEQKLGGKSPARDPGDSAERAPRSDLETGSGGIVTLAHKLGQTALGLTDSSTARFWAWQRH